MHVHVHGGSKGIKVTCEACLQKWKEPLPTPKTSSAKKNSIPKLEDDNIDSIKTSNMQILSNIIDRGRNKLIVYEKIVNENKENRYSRIGASVGNISSRQGSVEIVDLDARDLAKIRQEIKENETKKKLDMFMKKQVELNLAAAKASRLPPVI